MILEETTEQTSFLDILKTIFDSSKKDDSFKTVKEKVWNRLQELGLPSRKTEVFQYLRLKTLYKQSFVKAEPADLTQDLLKDYILPESKNAYLVFVNGHFNLELSDISALPKKLVVLTFKQAEKTYSSFIQNQWTKILKEDSDFFSLLNALLSVESLFIYAPPKTVIETPIQILHVSQNVGSSMLMAPRIHGFVGKESEINFVSTHVALTEEKNFYTLACELAIDEDSHVKITQDSSNMTHHAWYFDAFRATLKRNSTLKTFMATFGSDSLRHDYRVALCGENAEVSLNGLSMLANNDESHVHVLVEHQAPNCRSMQLFKNVLADTSHSSFEGKIYVHQIAQKTEAFQLNNNLILSEKARAESKPNLEIFADDVKASHGATVGQLDLEQLFYLKTRGFSDKLAKNVLVYGFIKQVIDLMPVKSIVERVDRQFKSYLS